MAMSQTVFRCLRHVLRVGLVSVTAAQFGCADEGARAGTQAATECARNNLAAQCPNNTIPRVEVDAMASFRSIPQTNPPHISYEVLQKIAYYKNAVPPYGGTAVL